MWAPPCFRVVKAGEIFDVLKFKNLCPCVAVVWALKLAKDEIGVQLLAWSAFENVMATINKD